MDEAVKCNPWKGQSGCPPLCKPKGNHPCAIDHAVMICDLSFSCWITSRYAVSLGLAEHFRWNTPLDSHGCTQFFWHFVVAFGRNPHLPSTKSESCIKQRWVMVSFEENPVGGEKPFFQPDWCPGPSGISTVDWETQDSIDSIFARFFTRSACIKGLVSHSNLLIYIYIFICLHYTAWLIWLAPQALLAFSM